MLFRSSDYIAYSRLHFGSVQDLMLESEQLREFDLEGCGNLHEDFKGRVLLPTLYLAKELVIQVTLIAQLLLGPTLASPQGPNSPAEQNPFVLFSLSHENHYIHPIMSVKPAKASISSWQTGNIEYNKDHCH